MAEFKAEKEVFKAAIEKYGQKAQSAMFIEEAAELTKEICKKVHDYRIKKIKRLKQRLQDSE